MAISKLNVKMGPNFPGANQIVSGSICSTTIDYQGQVKSGRLIMFVVLYDLLTSTKCEVLSVHCPPN